MIPSATPNPSKHHRFPGEILSQAVWLYCRFPLSHRDGEERLCVRGVLVSHEAIRKWCRKCGQQCAKQLRRWRPRPGDTWHLDEVCITIHKERHSLWRAVDQAGIGLDRLVQSRGMQHAAKQFFRKLLKALTYVPCVIMTATLKSDGAAKRERWPSVDHRQPRSLNHRVENAHHHTRQRERRMRGVQSPGHAQRFPAAYGPIAQHVRPRHHRVSVPAYRHEMQKRVQVWGDYGCRESCLRTASGRSSSALVRVLPPDEINLHTLSMPW